MSLPITYYATEWGGAKVPCATVRCISCGSEYSVSPEYDVNDPCPFCRSTCIKAVFALTDDVLILAMLGPDRGTALVAKRIYDARHAGDPQPKEPPHCSECFEGCPKCQPEVTPACTHPVIPDDDHHELFGVVFTRRSPKNFCILCGKHKDFQAMGLGPNGVKL